jgi:hypothetical protein
MLNKKIENLIAIFKDLKAMSNLTQVIESNTEIKNDNLKCNYINSKLSEKEWNRIQEYGKVRNHINKNSDLREIINKDMETLKKHGIEIKQINDMFKKIKLHLKSADHIDIDEEDYKIFEKIFSSIDTRGWCCWGNRKYRIFNDSIDVLYIWWGGSEGCCFQSELDKKYHGYEYGNSDYIFIKNGEYLHVGSLLIHQIEKHNFFQDTESKFRVDPEKLINFFCMKPNINYETDFIEDKYIEYIALSSSTIGTIYDNWYSGGKVNKDDYKIIEHDSYKVRIPINKKSENDPQYKESEITNKLLDIAIEIEKDISEEYINILDGRLYGYFRKGTIFNINRRENISDKNITEKEKNIQWVNL